jgi:hypothetical protein
LVQVRLNLVYYLPDHAKTTLMVDDFGHSGVLLLKLLVNRIVVILARLRLSKQRQVKMSSILLRMMRQMNNMLLITHKALGPSPFVLIAGAKLVKFVLHLRCVVLYIFRFLVIRI